jgi:hypothetical protein
MKVPMIITIAENSIESNQKVIFEPPLSEKLQNHVADAKLPIVV